MRRLLLAVVALVLCFPLAQVVPAVGAAAAEPVPTSSGAAVKAASPAAAVPARTAAAAQRDRWSCWHSVKPTCRIGGGVTFNNPYGTRAQKYAVINKIISSIRRTPPYGTIQIMSWNILSATAYDALINAARRGVRVRVLMDAGNHSREVPNPGFTRMVRGFKASNRKWPASRRSSAHKCVGSCRRSRGGSAHAKYFMFSQVGATKHVVIQGSANLTNASARNQWNDVYTYINKSGLYRFVDRVFGEMWRDRKVQPSWVGFKRPTYELYFSPRFGGATDPLARQLANVRCKGAVAGNARGRTIIRTAPDVLRGRWGLSIAKRLKALWNYGCDVRVAYTIIGIDVKRVLQRRSGRGPVPMKHFVADRNGDRVFDEYFHLKVWTINGRSRVGGVDDRNYHWTMNGSSNISDLSRVSDENIGVFKLRGVTLQYQRFIDRWWRNPPRSRPAIPSLVPANLDPYANMEKDY